MKLCDKDIERLEECVKCLGFHRYCYYCSGFKNYQRLPKTFKTVKKPMKAVSELQAYTMLLMDILNLNAILEEGQKYLDAKTVC
jgi:hypothetical protein